MYPQSRIIAQVLALFAVWSSLSSVHMDELDEPSARILLHKSTPTSPVAVGQDFVVTYQVVNIGDATATKIEIEDTFPLSSFEAIANITAEGLVAFELEELEPGADHVFSVTVKPLEEGVFESTRAQISYGSGTVEIEGVEPDIRSGFSSSLGRMLIISADAFERQTRYYIKEWGLFSLGLAVTVLAPLYSYLRCRSTSKRISMKGYFHQKSN